MLMIDRCPDCNGERYPESKYFDSKFYRCVHVTPPKTLQEKYDELLKEHKDTKSRLECLRENSTRIINNYVGRTLCLSQQKQN